ncbi:MAG: hypothetical protein IKB07_12520 [Lachnospiraceae bacterium]|nr:hypothetical protein [Lachnospiraceae bacterium]
MEKEWKRAMNYMWSSKAMRRSFGCGFELIGNGGMLLVMAVAMLVPLFAKLVGINVSVSVCKWAYIVAFFCHMLMQVIVIEVPLTIYWVSGKGMGGVPFAKWLMTKGFVINQLICYVCGLVLILGMHTINMAVGVLDVSWIDEILFLPGLFFLWEAMFQIVGSLLDRDGTSRAYFGGTLSGAVVALPTLVGRIRMSVGVAFLFQVLFVVVGVILMYLSLLQRYKKRSGEH